MIITPNVNLTDQQFLALQQRAIRMEITMEQLVEREIVAIALKEIVYRYPVGHEGVEE